jgi:hypothetical protein
MERYIGRECGRDSGGFETWIVSMSKATGRIFHEEMISDRALANVDRPLRNLAPQPFHPASITVSAFFALPAFRTPG